MAASVLVWLAFRRRNALYALAAILYHAAFDGLTVYLSQFVTNPWLLEGVVLALALPGLAFVAWSYRRWGATEPPHAPPAWRVEWRAYLALLRKELLEQWRTRKVLVMAIVFLLFGLTAPLMARFVTEILMSLPGAEQFADLVPTPQAADAVGQYIESITQFGFIIVLLVTMGLLAGEKERGTAAMTLSKPVPRWAFVLSKFDALALTLLPILLLAGLGAGYYTNLLFTPGLNLGLGLLFTILLLVGGAFPQAAALLPGGLVSWAAQLALPPAAPATSSGWGALAGTLVVIGFCLVSAVGVVERQEV